MSIKTTNPELKEVRSRYWAGDATRAELETVARDIRKENWLTQQKLGADVILSNDFSICDRVLDTAMMLHMVPLRYQIGVPGTPLDIYFAMYRGTDKLAPLTMARWFDTYEYYTVPELSEHVTPALTSRKPINEYKEAKRLGVQTRPVLLGPVSFLLLSKVREGEDKNPIQFLEGILPVYAMVLKELYAAGAEWVQVDEPCLTQNLHPAMAQAYKRTYEFLKESVPLKLMLWCSGSLGPNEKIVDRLPVDGVQGSIAVE